MESAEAPSKSRPHTLPRWVSCPNPFYLFSAAFVLHSTGWNANGHGLPPWLIPVLVAGYIAVMAATAALIVRLWKVWDDARTILVTLFLLFLELALSLDQFAIAQPQWGPSALLAGWLFSIGVTEGLLRGLRMRLPGLYRASLHVQLALMFAYPLLLIPGARAADNAHTTDLLAWYAFAIAVPLLMLWPKVRRGPSAVADNGTPWRWPMYPWTAPVVMSACLVGRSFSLCLTFDGAPLLDADAAYQGWQSIWGAEFAAPVVFAAGLLLLEGGIVARRRGLQWLGLALPVLAFALCAVGGTMNPARQAFLERLVDVAVAPTWGALLAGIAFYSVAALRGVSGAWRGMAAVGVGLACIPMEALSIHEWLTPGALTWAALAAGLMSAGLWSRRTAWCLEAATYAVIAMWSARLFALDPLLPERIAAAHVWVAALILIATLFDDGVARAMRELGMATVSLGALIAAVASVHLPEPWWLIPADLAAMAALLGFVWLMRRAPGYGSASAVVAVAAYVCAYWQGAAELWRTVRWSGLPSFAIGVALLHVGILVSAWKGRLGAPGRLASQSK
jgi:hypothetical protein